MANYFDGTISLCISYRNWNDKLQYYRIADYSLNKLEYIDYRAEVGPDDYILAKLHLDPKERKYENKPVLKRWDKEKRKVFNGFINIGKINEIVFLEDNIDTLEYDYKKVRDKLYKGFEIPFGVDNEFLLLVGNKNGKWITLLCNKKDFEKKEYENDEYCYGETYFLNQNSDIISIPIYKIPPNETVSTKGLTDILNIENIILKNRYFYNRLEIPKKEGNFVTMEKNDLAQKFAVKYIEQKKNVFQITDDEKYKIIKIISNFLKDEKYIKEIINITGLSYDDLIRTVESIFKPILDLYLGNDKLDNLVGEYLLKNEKVLKECIELAKEIWLNSKDEEITKVKNELKEWEELSKIIKSEIDNLKLKKDEKKKEVESLDLSIIEKNDFINELENKKINIEIEIEDQLIDFKSNIVETTKLLGVAESYNTDNFRKKESKDKSLLYIESEKLEESDIYRREEYEDLEDVYYSLSENLEENLSKSEDIAISIITSILMKKFIVVDEYLGRKIADDLAMIISSSTTDYISITNVDIDVELLIKFINDSKSSVVYIDGLLDTFNSNLVSTIYKNCNNKRIILGFLEENLLELPKSIWNYSIYIDYSDKIRFRRDDEKIIGNYDKLFDIENSGIFEECKLKNLFEEEDTCRRLYKRKYINRKNNLDMSLYVNLSKEIGEIISLDFLNNIYLQASDVNRAKLVGDLVKFGFSEEEILKSLFANEE